jgi:large subunit ribosomal protein L22
MSPRKVRQVVDMIRGRGVDESMRTLQKEAFVDEGPTMKRFRARAMGRATTVRKRTSHITIVVGERTGKQA